MNKRTESLHSDIINTLPQNIIENILSLMPLRDALRTSVLSKKWRYIWRSMPKLVFTDNLVGARYKYYPRTKKKYKLVNAIFHVLLLHNGPTILVFDCPLDELEIASEFEQILIYLSRENKVKELTFHNDYRSYKLPAFFFSLQRLERIRLKYCTFEPPLTYNRFSCLTCLVFINVEVSAQMLRRFLSKCPLLEHIQLIGHQKRIDFVKGGNKFTFVDLLQCVPLVKFLNISKYYMKYLSAGGMSHKLPTSLFHLENLYLSVCMTDKNQISSALGMIRSSPLLVNVVFKMYDNEKFPVRKTSLNFLDLEEYLNLNLDHLEIFEIRKISSNIPLVMDLVKFIMAKSPMLEKVRIELNLDVAIDEEVKMLRDMLLLPFQRASHSAKLIVQRKKTL